MATIKTEKQAQAISEPGKHRVIGEPCLVLVVGEGARGPTRRWSYIYEERGEGGRRLYRELGLGPLHTRDLRGAKEEAKAFRLARLEGRDPKAEKARARAAARAAAKAEAAKAVTFREAAEAFHATHSGKWSNAKWARRVMSVLSQYAYPVIGDMSPAEIDQPTILRMLEKDNLWRAKPSTASRLRQWTEGVLDFAAQRGLRDASAPNPAAWRLLKHALPAANKEATNFAALDYRKARSLMTRLGELSGTRFRLLEFLILTAVRLNEASAARWSEIDLTNGLWVVPASRMKARKEHRVPLSKRAVALLAAMPRTGDDGLIFPGARPGAPLAGSTVLYSLRDAGEEVAVVHGIRTAFRTYASEQTAFPYDVIEICLAHSVGNAVERAYNRTDLLERRRALMEAWASYLAAPAGDNVVPLKAAAAS